MFYFMRKEVLDSEKYKKTLSKGQYANEFSGHDLTLYDWATAAYWKQILAYIHDDTEKAPWSDACWERYEFDNDIARQANREMARSEEGKQVPKERLPRHGPRVEMGFLAVPRRGNTAAVNRPHRDGAQGPPAVQELDDIDVRID